MSTVICRWLFLLLFLTWTSIIDAKEIRVVCYYTNWSVYRPGSAKFSPQNINPYLCTHLIYAFGGFTKENTLKPFDKYQDIEKGGYAKFTGLKTYNKNLKTMLAIGGWNEGSSRFSPMVANAERRKELVKNAIKFLRQNHFDGLDLDWEYPSFRDGGKSRDRDNYAQLVQELREEFDRESEKTGRTRLLLTMAVPAGIEYINKGYDVPKLTRYLDWMNILSYDYHSAFEPAVNHHAPLFSLEEPSEYNYDTDLNIDFTIKHYLKMGAEPNKLVLGIPTYGRSYTLYNPDANEVGSPADGPGDMGEATRENGYLAYYEICENVKSQNWEVVQPNPDAMGPYAFKNNQWVGYDDDNIARKKSEYVAANGLGGIMFWSIDNDDFRGTCHGKPYPIIEAAKEALISAYGLTDENLVAPPAKPIKAKPRTRPTTEEPETKKPSTVITNRRRNRNKNKTTSESTPARPKNRRKESKTTTTTDSTVYSSLELVTPSYTTPAPPSTPDHGGGFKCEEEGFFAHPKDCKKYYWCLGGPGELGIVAHQFTCPAGLYFNKAADSCDYTQNVLCNKKLSKSTSPTATTTTTTQASSTKKVPPKITTTSRPVFRTTTTTTEAPVEDDYEYEDDVEDAKNSEEDPKVIKELLDLIKKAGGIEQLEKQLKFQENSGNSETTPSTISKSLVEKVLGKSNILTRKNNKYTLPNRNSRGPQNEGLSETDVNTEKKERPQYTTITRQRAPNTETAEEEKPKKDKEYVSIRRTRTSTTTEKPTETQVRFDRNKALGEEDEENVESTTAKKSSSPQYVNIRRQRPSTTEESATTSKYTVIRRGTTTTEANQATEASSTTVSSETSLKSKYKILRRGSTTAAPVDSSLSTLQDKLTTVSFQETTQPEVKTSSSTGTTYPSRGSTTYSQSTSSVSVETTQSLQSTTPETLTIKSSVVNTSEKRAPVQFEPRPFSLSTDPSSITSLKPVTEQSTKITTKKSGSVAIPYLFRVGGRRKPSPALQQTNEETTATTSAPKQSSRSTKIPQQRRKQQPITTTSKPLESQVSPTVRASQILRQRTVSRRPFLRTTTQRTITTTTTESTNDQRIESSMQQSLEEFQDNDTTELGNVAFALHELQQAPLPLPKTTTTPKPKRGPTRSRHRFSTTQPPTILSTLTTPKKFLVRKQPPQTFDKITNYQPVEQYNYYDQGEMSVLGQIPEHSKVLLHSNGVIECLDQGNFPHPISCKKFISCAKMENGQVLGWEYSCPKNLSFDPIGGICNWAADLGCPM